MKSNETDLKSIGERIRQLRENIGLTQSDLAKKLNVKRETVTQWEAGTRDLKTGYIIDLADCLNVSCDEILRGVKSENISTYKDLGLTDTSINNLKEIKKEEMNANILLEYDKLNDIVRHLTTIQVINALKRYFAVRINGDFKNDKVIQSATESSSEACEIFSNSIMISINKILKEFNIDFEVLRPFIRENSTIASDNKTFADKICEAMDRDFIGRDEKHIDEKSILTEYELTEHIIRNLINAIKQGDEGTDNKIFQEFDYWIDENLTLKTKFALSLYSKANSLSTDIQEELKALTLLQPHFNKYYGKKGR